MVVDGETKGSRDKVSRDEDVRQQSIEIEFTSEADPDVLDYIDEGIFAKSLLKLPLVFIVPVIGNVVHES